MSPIDVREDDVIEPLGGIEFLAGDEKKAPVRNPLARALQLPLRDVDAGRPAAVLPTWSRIELRSP
jgi:hypothetical protein